MLSITIVEKKRLKIVKTKPCDLSASHGRISLFKQLDCMLHVGRRHHRAFDDSCPDLGHDLSEGLHL